MKVRYISVPGERKEDGRIIRKPAGEDFWYAELRGGALIAAVGDWASNLMGGKYKDADTADALEQDRETEYNGGVIGAQTARRVIAGSGSTGDSLIGEINQEMERKYRQLGVDVSDPRYRFAGFLSHIYVTPDKMTVTWVGDVKVYSNGRHVIGEETEVQRFMNRLRREYIRQTGDFQGAYDILKPFIADQQRFQNTTGHPLSYAAITGAPMLEGIMMKSMPCPSFNTLIFSDGFVVARPREGHFRAGWMKTIEDMENNLVEAYEIDPHRCNIYPAAGELLDDRTAVEITGWDDWSRLEMEEVLPIFKR